MNKHDLTVVAGLVYAMVLRETDHAILTDLAEVVLALKPLLDMADIHPDLGLSLLEFVYLRRDGRFDVSTEFGNDVAKIVREAGTAK